MRVRFYQPERRFADDPQACLHGLASQAFEQGERVAWLVEDRAAAAVLDKRLWELPPDSFIPHQIAGQDDDPHCPVLILPAPLTAGDRGVLINQRRTAVSGPATTVIELIPADPAGIKAARARWRDYQARGLTPELIKL